MVFIVIATGAVGHMLIPASLGAAAAGVLVILLGLLIHKPLSRVPENMLKFAVGILLSAFGVFWVGGRIALSVAGGRPLSLWTCGRLPDSFGARCINGTAGRRIQ